MGKGAGTGAGINGPGSQNAQGTSTGTAAPGSGSATGKPSSGKNGKKSAGSVLQPLDKTPLVIGLVLFISTFFGAALL